MDSPTARPGSADPAGVDAMLAEMALAAQESFQSAPPAPRTGARPPKIRYTHEAMADTILANPAISQNELAQMFGYTPAWISTVITSDAFQSFLHTRKAELVDPELRFTLEERFRGLTTQALKVLQEKLAKPTDQVSDQLALRAAELGAKALGIGGNAPPPPPPNPAEYLPQLAERLLRLQGRTPPQPVSDATIVREE